MESDSRNQRIQLTVAISEINLLKRPKNYNCLCKKIPSQFAFWTLAYLNSCREEPRPANLSDMPVKPKIKKGSPSDNLDFRVDLSLKEVLADLNEIL